MRAPEHTIDLVYHKSAQIIIKVEPNRLFIRLNYVFSHRDGFFHHARGVPGLPDIMSQ